MPASRFPCGGAPSGLTWGEGGRRGLGRPLAPAAESPCCTQPRLPTEARPWLSRRFPLGVLATASAASGAVYTVGPRTPPPPPLPPSLHPSAVVNSAAATSSAAASSLWSIFQPPNPEKQRLQPRRQETPPQLLGGRSGQSTGGFSAIEQQPLRSFCNPPPRTLSFPAPRRAPPPAPTHWDAARYLAVPGLLDGPSITALPPSPAAPVPPSLVFPAHNAPPLGS